MVVSDFLYEVRRVLVDTQEPYLWDDEELLSYLNEILFFTIREAGLMELKYQFQTQSDIQSYPLPNGFEVIISVYCNNKKLSEYLYDYIENLDFKGEPRYFGISTSSIVLYPIPDNIYDISIYYVGNIISPLVLDSELPIPEWFNLFLKHGIMWRAYLKEDTEIFDMKLAQYHRQEFMNGINLLKSRYTRDSDVPQPSYIHRGLL